MLIFGVKNPTTQTVATDGLVNVGNVYRKFCCKNSCGVGAFGTNTQSINLNHCGIYHITATFVASATVAGDVTFQLLLNDVEATGAFATETITTPNTEFRTFVIDYYVLVDTSCVLGYNSVASQTITFQNTGVEATITSVVVNVDKVKA
jgi:hypothetical protein